MAPGERIDDFRLEALIKASDNGEEWAQREYGRIFDEYDMDPDFIDRVCRARINIYKAPAERGDKNAILRYAHALAHLGYTKVAYDWYMKLINAGDTDAMLALSAQYNEYGSFGNNPNEKMRWLRRAADGGNAEAQCEMGLHCLCEGDKYNALLWYELSAKQNNIDGKIGYAECLYEQLSNLDLYLKGWDESHPGQYRYIKETYGRLSPQEGHSVKKDLFRKIEGFFLDGLQYCNSETYLANAYNGLARLYLYPQNVCYPSPYLAAYYHFDHYLVLNNKFAYDSCIQIIKENNLNVTKQDLQEWDEFGVFEWAKKHRINIFGKEIPAPASSPSHNTPTESYKPSPTSAPTYDAPKKTEKTVSEPIAALPSRKFILPDGIYLFKTATCPSCKVAEYKLKKANIEFDRVFAFGEDKAVKEFAVTKVPTLIVIKNGSFEKYVGVSAITEFIG